MGFVAGLMGFVAGRDFLKKVPSPHPSQKTLGRGRENYCIEIVTTYAFFQPFEADFRALAITRLHNSRYVPS